MKWKLAKLYFKKTGTYFSELIILKALTFHLCTNTCYEKSTYEKAIWQGLCIIQKIQYIIYLNKCYKWITVKKWSCARGQNIVSNRMGARTEIHQYDTSKTRLLFSHSWAKTHDTLNPGVTWLLSSSEFHTLGSLSDGADYRNSISLPQSLLN